MKRLRTVAMTFALILATASCVGNNGSLLIEGAALIESAGSCTAAGSTGNFRSRGVLDLNVARSYGLFLVLRNQMPNSASPVNLTLDGRTVVLELVRMKYRSQNQVSLPERSEPVLGSVESGGGSATVGVNVLGQAQIDQLRADPTITQDRPSLILVNLVLDGRMTGGGHISSTEVTYPITVCRGCLRKPLEPAVCPADAEAIEVCNPGQDDAMDCAAYDLNRR